MTLQFYEWQQAKPIRGREIVLERVFSIVLALLSSVAPALAENLTLIVDDRRSGDYRSALGGSWRLVTDNVMGGLSQGQLTIDYVDGAPCLRLRGDVSLENNGGFVQAALDLGREEPLDASSYAGVLLEVHGNGEVYNVHLRTTDIRLPWQSYRASFEALPRWQTVRLPFGQFTPYRIGTPLDVRRLQRLGLVAIGRRFTADLCLRRLALYRARG